LPDVVPQTPAEQVSELDRDEVIRALQARERFLTGIIGSLESFFTIDAQWRCTFANEAGVALLGMTQEELLGRDVREFLLDALREEVSAELDVAMTGRRAVTLRSKDSRQGPPMHEATAYPLSDGGLAVYIRDVTRLELAEADAVEAERRYGELVENVNSAILRWTRDGTLTFFNTYAEQLFGWRADEVLGRHVSILLPEGDEVGEDLSHLAEDIVAHPDRYVNNVNQNVRKDGSRLWMAWTNRPLLDERGELSEVLVVGNDVTELVAAQAALREREEERIAQEERSRLARDLHDSVTQALFAATMKVEALTLSSDAMSSEDVRAVEEVWRLNRGALAQMRTLLLELRGDPLEEVPLQRLLRQLTEAAEARSSASVHLTVRGDERLPPDVHVAIYRITQEALTNVTRHAKASKVWVDLDLTPGEAHLVIGDDGCGFDPGSVGGAHLGLRSMRERAAQVGAELDVRSTPDGGTVVTLVWPPAARGGRAASSERT
jgi:PAS domain S-box-containing protein